MIGAISIARRFQDPLSEYVKIDPKNLGVGMYQHDVNETKLKNTLEEILIECVSCVGKVYLILILQYRFKAIAPLLGVHYPTASLAREAQLH